ncbi:hypothetical protein 2 [Sanxia tombus-like virus 4]|uniref:hypothetical protein 2 n=1 Tax=Sanxia tombus-like virus 4 TaxID=1923388 RepID=UPI0009097B9D|nr:hypothetical protein 2 [Sanxia tombus-like virus 4]APG76432.1 hypothetical protein 2 [Sanxia tombus-like virus 4]
MDVKPFEKTLDNVVSGIKERIMYIDDAGTRRPVCRRNAGELKHLTDKLADCVPNPTRMTRREFIASRNGRLKKVYERANEMLDDQPSSLEDLARTSLFTKWERSVHKPGKTTVPRIINPRSPQFNILLGRYLTPIEHQIFEGLQEMLESPHPVIAKGLTQSEKGQIIADIVNDGYVVVGLDASRFDQCISEELLKMEHNVYLKCYQNDRLLRALLKCQLDNSGQYIGRDGRVKVRYGAIRCSGDMNTSLGNCIISVLLSVLFCDENGIGDFRVFCDGDDLLLAVRRGDLNKLNPLQQWYLQWGLRMKVEEPAYTPEAVEFCQSRPVCIDGRYVLIRDVRKCINVDYSGFVNLQDRDYMLKYLRAVGVCGSYLAAGCPVLQAWYGFGVRVGTTGKLDVLDTERGFTRQAKLEQRSGAVMYRPIDDGARESFRLAFGIGAAEQLLLESIFDEMTLERGQLDSHPQEITDFSNTFAFLVQPQHG